MNSSLTTFGKQTAIEPYTAENWTAFKTFRSQVGVVAKLKGYDRFLRMAELEDAFAQRLMGKLLIPGRLTYLKVFNNAGNFIGEIILNFASEANETVYISWVGAPAYRGQGLMSDAVHTICKKLFGHYGLHRIVASICPENEPSRHLAASVGFRHESTAVKSTRTPLEDWYDVEYWALLKEDLRGDRD